MPWACFRNPSSSAVLIRGKRARRLQFELLRLQIKPSEESRRLRGVAAKKRPAIRNDIVCKGNEFNRPFFNENSIGR